MRVKLMYANIGKLITSALDVNGIMEGIMREIRIFFKPQDWSLMRLDPAANELFFVVAHGIDNEKVRNVRLRLGEGIAGTVAETKKALFIPDAEHDPRFSAKVDALTGYTTKSILAVPLLFQDVVYGVIELVNREEPEYYTEDECLVLQTIADFAAIAFAHSRLYEQSLALLHSDPLTGVGNLAWLTDSVGILVDEELHRRETDDLDGTVAVMMIDIDNLHFINEKYGHKEGDWLLREFALSLKKSLRAEDMIFRTAGDTFTVLLKNQDSKGAVHSEARIREDTAKIPIDLNRSYAITFTAGLAAGRINDLRSLIDQAEAALYEKKNQSK